MLIFQDSKVPLVTSLVQNEILHWVKLSLERERIAGVRADQVDDDARECIAQVGADQEDDSA